jgi:ribosome recycling factor
MIDALLAQTRDRMKKAFEVTQTDLSSVRSGRATPALVENIVIAAYGGSQKLRILEMATITTMDAKTLVISPWDPSVIGDLEKGILEANIGLTPVIDGELIRMSIPPLSEERRQEYIKLARAKLESGRIMIRQIRHEAMRDLRTSNIAEDERKHGEKKVQELTDEMIAEIDVLGDRKEQELLQV